MDIIDKIKQAPLNVVWRHAKTVAVKSVNARSQAEFIRSCDAIAGGVNSPVRAFKAMGGTPVFFKEGRGAVVTDVDGRHFIDLCLSWGAPLFGHADPAVARAVSAQAKKGTSFGAATPQETLVAEKTRALLTVCSCTQPCHLLRNIEATPGGQLALLAVP